MSDMPNIIHVSNIDKYGKMEALTYSENAFTNYEKYHHDSILQAKDREIAELEQTIRDYKEANEDKKRLTREIDVIINGDGAAQQASLCDVVGDIKALVSVEAKLKSRIATLENKLQDQALAELARIAQDEGHGY